MISKFFRCAAMAGLIASPVLADESSSPAAPVGKYSLKKRSVIHLPNGTRAPFWPIGWVKGAPATAKAEAAPQPLLNERSFRVTSILLGSPSLAVINGRAYSEGEYIRMPKETGGLRVRVQRISDGLVMLQHDQQMLSVQLTRAELGPKKPEMEYLSDDR